MKFSDLGLKPEILRAVEDAGYETPTPIQAKAIPVVLERRDVLGIAQTGTGKTAGFTLPMIQHLAKGRARARMPRSLILEPTRELASQVAENFDKYTKYENLNYALLIGGERFDEQVKRLDRGVDVLIATPGRMIDLFERGKVLLADVKILVIDEADRMLDMGFIPDIERIVGLLPRKRQTLFFSATMPKEIRRLADAFLDSPEEIAVSRPATTAEGVEQKLIRVAKSDKRDALRRLLGAEDVRNALVFCNRKRDVGVVFNSLKKHGFSVGQLHGDMPQPARTETLDRFKKGEIQILVCSDVAARGIDITDLSHVFNFDVPIHADDYVHRIGRTGRAGRSGRAFTLATPEEGKYVAAIEDRVSKKFDIVDLDGVEQPTAEAEEDDGRGRGRRRRKPRAEGRAPEAVEPQAVETEAVETEAQGDVADRPEPEPEPEAQPVSARDGRSRGRGDRERERDRPGRDRDRGGDRGRSRSGRRRESDGDFANAGVADHEIVGFGDHMPEFLRRPAFPDTAPEPERAAS